MILFLSSAFLRHLRMQWTQGLKGLLIGDRNLFFFYPELLLEASDISTATINSFLQTHGEEGTQLIGFLSPEEIAFLPGYAEVMTGNASDPRQWRARVHLLGDQGPEFKNLEITIGDTITKEMRTEASKE